MSKIYCIYCGSSNDSKNKKCIKCKKYLNAHDFELLKFIGGEVKDDAKGKVIDYVIEFIKSLFTKHIYGTILSLAVITATTGTILNITNNEKDTFEGNITNDKYLFNQLDDNLKFTGCWYGTNDYEEDTIRYLKFYDGDKVTSLSMTNNISSGENNSYYDIILYYQSKHLHFYPDISHKEVEVQTFPFVFVDNDTFRYGELNYYEYLYKRMDCKDFPK